MPKYAKSMSADPQKVKVSYSSYSGESCLDPRSGKSNIGPGPVIPPGAPGPESKGRITPPKPAVGGGR